MTTEVCLCDLGLGNTGIPQGVKPPKQLSYLIMVSTYDGLGNLNRIDCADTLDQAYLDARFNDPDPLKRWYPVKDLKLVDRPKADPLTRDLGDGSIEFVRDGVRSFTAEIPSGTATYLKSLVGARCQSVSFFEVDICENLTGNGREKGYLYPIKLSDQSLNAFLLLANDSQNQSISLNFQYDITEYDHLRAFITDRSITGSLTPIDVNGLIDVQVFSFDDIQATSIDVTLKYFYGDHCDPLPYKVAEQTDFTLYNKTTASAVALTGFVVLDASEGKYQIQFGAQTGGDKVCLSISPADKSGFEMLETEFTAV